MWPGLVLTINSIWLMKIRLYFLVTTLMAQDKIEKIPVFKRLREHFYGQVDSVDWSVLIKEYVVDGYLRVPKPILRMNHVINYIAETAKKSDALQLIKEKTLKLIEIIIKLSMKKMGSVINKTRYKIIVHFQDKYNPFVSILIKFNFNNFWIWHFYRQRQRTWVIWKQLETLITTQPSPMIMIQYMKWMGIISWKDIQNYSMITVSTGIRNNR